MMKTKTEEEESKELTEEQISKLPPMVRGILRRRFHKGGMRSPADKSQKLNIEK